MKLLVIFPLLALLAACQAGVSYRHDNALLPAVERVILNTDFKVRASRATEYVQGGKQITYAERSRYQPHCYLELRDLTTAATVITPDTFAVTRIQLNRDMAAREPVMVAFTGGGSSGNPVMSTTWLYLSSAQQPNVWRLGCQVLTDPHDAHYVSLAAMQEALGDIMTLE